MKLPLLPTLTMPLILALAANAAPKVEEVYANRCSACHGPELKGGLGGSLVDGVWKHGDTDEAVAKVIRDGMPSLGMPPMGKELSPEQVRALVVFIREREAKESKAKTPAPKPDAHRVYRSKLAAFRMETVVAAIPGTPWAVAPAKDGRLFLTEKSGKLFVLGPGDRVLPKPVEGVPATLMHGQGGLMDVALHPDFEHNGWVYLALSEGTDIGGDVRCDTALVRGRVKDGRWTDTEWLWRSAPEFHIGAGAHFGSRIVFDGKGFVFFIVGERGRNADRGAQDVSTPHGKIFRLHDDGRVPEDWKVEIATGRTLTLDKSRTSGSEDFFRTAIPGLWSYGHRNPQGLAFDPRNGDLYDTEHGPRGGDELNLIRPGLNYGWPLVTYGINYNGQPWAKGETARPGLEPPVTWWTPSIAVCGTCFVTGEQFPAWKNDLLVGALAGQQVRRLRITDRKVVDQEILFRDLGRVRDVKCGPDGSVYVIFNDPGRLVKLVPEK